METATYSAYNITRNTLLSEQVASVSNIQDSEQLLARVLSGPGRDPKSALLLTTIESAIEIPRIFAFDIAYLDHEHRIVEAAGVGPGTPFPPLGPSVTSILFLSDQCLATSGTLVGDIVKICNEAELVVLLRTASQPQPADTLQMASVPPDVHLDLRQSIEPFDGSLIFLPASGTRQSVEFFLPIEAPRAHPPDSTKESINQATPLQPVTSETEVAARSVPIELPQSPEQPTSNREEEQEVPYFPTPAIPPTSTSPPARFLVLHTVTEAQPPKQAEPTKLAEPTKHAEAMQAPQLTGLSPQLKAIIQKVDEQLLRERKRPEEPPRHNEASDEKGEAANRDAIQPPILSGAEGVPAGLQQQAQFPAQVEQAVPAISIENTQGLKEKIHAAEGGISAAEPPAQPQIIRSEATAPPAGKVSRAHAAATHRKNKLRTPRPAKAHAAPQVTQPAPPQPTPAQTIPPPPAERADKQVGATLARSKEKISFANRVQRWLAGESISLSGNRRRGERIALPGLVAFYWTGGAPQPYEILNISRSGLYLRSKEMWSPDTVVRMTLERPDPHGGERKSIGVLARVVRSDDGGVAHEFVTTEVIEHLRARDFLPEHGTNRKKLEKFLELN